MGKDRLEKRYFIGGPLDKTIKSVPVQMREIVHPVMETKELIPVSTEEIRQMKKFSYFTYWPIDFRANGEFFTFMVPEGVEADRIMEILICSYFQTKVQ
jgi:hypothetical protein